MFPLTSTYTVIRARHKIAATFFSFGILMGTAGAQDNRSIEKASYLTEGGALHGGYGRKKQQDVNYDGYCDKTPCARSKQVNRMSHVDRQMLREQVNEAGKTLYPFEQQH